jgi:adenylate kinase family enzyme
MEKEIIERTKMVLMKNPVIILIGQSGCGKGTQKINLEKTFVRLGFLNNFFVIETGDLFRKQIQKFGSFFRNKINEIQEAGKLQSPEYATFLWKQEMLYNYSGGPIIIDGSPRSIPEAQSMIDFFYYELGREMIVFYFTIPDDIAKERILERNTRDLKEGEQRTDTNTDQKISEKLRYFKTDVFPAIDYLNKKPGSAVYTIDGLQNPVAIHEQIISLIGMHVKK